MKRTATLLILMICTVISTYAETEPNNNSSQANTINFNGSTTGSLDSTDVVDWFKISTSFDAAITITGIFDDTLFARVELYDMNMNLLDSSFSGTDTLIASFQCAQADAFWVKLVHRSGKGNYTLKTNFKLPLVLLTETEPNNTSGQFVDFTTGNASGSIGAHLGYEDRNKNTDTKDWFRFITTKNGQLHLITTIDSSLTAKIVLYDDKFVTRASSSANVTGKVEFVLNCIAPDTFFVEVDRNSGCGSYVLKYEVDTPAVAADNEPNDIKADAVWLPGDTTLSGHVGLKDQANNVDQLDWYAFQPKTDGKITINAVFDSTITGNLFLLNKVNGQVTSPATGTGKVSMEFRCAATDTFFVRVFGFNGCGGYTITYELDTPTALNDAEPNNVIANSISVDNLASFEGHLGYINSFAKTDTTDWYKLPFNVRTNRFKLTTVLDSGLEASVIIYDSLLNVLTTTTIVKDTVIRELSCLQAEAHYIRFRLGTGCGGYKATIELTQVKVNNDQEPNNSGLTAQPIAADTFTGHLGYMENGVNSKFDYFSINLTKDDGNCFKFTSHLSGQYQMAVLDSNLGNIPPGFTGQGDTFKVSNIVPPYTGKYIIRIENGTNTCTDYTVTRIKTLDEIGFVKPIDARCVNDFVNMSAIFTGIVPDSVYWEMEDAIKINDFGLNVSPQFTSAGWKDITIKAFNCAGVFIRNDSVYITPEPTSNFTYAKVGQHDILFTNASTDYDSLVWFFDDGGTSEVENPTYSYNITRKYEVCLQTFNDCGTDVYCDSVFAIGVGVRTVELPEYVKVYPNPASSVITIDLTTASEIIKTLDVYTISGELVKMLEVNDGIAQLNVAALPKGVYIIAITTDKAVYRTKITVE